MKIGKTREEIGAEGVGGQNPRGAVIWPHALPINNRGGGAMGQSRRVLLAGDPDRGTAVVWARRPVQPDGAGPMPRYTAGWTGEPMWTLWRADGTAAATVARRPAGRNRVWWDPTFHGEFRVPPGTAAGKYKLQAGQALWNFEIQPAPPRARLAKEETLEPGPGFAKAMQAALDDSKIGRITLVPGRYRLPAALYCGRAAGVTICGTGAEITYEGPAPDDPNAFVNLFGWGDWMVFDGVTFRGPHWVRPFQQDTWTNLTLKDCAFRGGCKPNDPGPGMHVERGEFEGGGAFVGQHGGLFRRCMIHDSDNDAYIAVFKADGNLAEIDTVRERADRGLMLQPNWGDIKDILVLGQGTYDTIANEGGSEGGVSVEIGAVDAAGMPLYGLRDSLILHSRYRGGAGGGSALQVDGAMTGCLVRDFKASGGWGLFLYGKHIEDNDFDAVELRDGAAVRLGAGAANNRFTSGAVANYSPGAWNLSDVRPGEMARTASVHWDETPGPGNLFAGWAFVLSPPFVPAQDPAVLMLTECLWNGAAYPVPAK